MAADVERARRGERTARRRALPRPDVADVPVVVLGADAARRLGITSLPTPASRRVDGGEWFAVIGILDRRRSPRARQRGAGRLRGRRGRCSTRRRSPSTLFVRSVPDQVEAVRAVLARASNPEAPNEVDVSRPSDALEARADDGRRAAQPAARPRRGGAARRWRGHHQRDGDLRARTARRDRRPPRARRRAHATSSPSSSPRRVCCRSSEASSAAPSAPAVTAIYASRAGGCSTCPSSALAAGAGVALAVGLARRRVAGGPRRPARPGRGHPPGLTRRGHHNFPLREDVMPTSGQGLEQGPGGVDVAALGEPAADREAQGDGSVEHGAGEQRLAGVVGRGDQRVGRRVARPQAEAQQVQRVGGDDLEAVVRGDPPGQLPASSATWRRIISAAGADTVDAEREPQLQRAEPAAERDLPVAVVDRRAGLARPASAGTRAGC